MEENEVIQQKRYVQEVKALVISRLEVVLATVENGEKRYEKCVYILGKEGVDDIYFDGLIYTVKKGNRYRNFTSRVVRFYDVVVKNR